MAKKSKNKTQIRIVYNKNGRVLFKQSLSLLLPRLRCCCCCCRLALSFKENTHIHIFICMCVCDLENCAAKIKMFNLFHFVHYADADCAAHWRCLHYSPLPSSALLNSLPSPPPPLLLCTLSCAFTFQCTMGISKHFLFTAFIISFRV